MDWDLMWSALILISRISMDSQKLLWPTVLGLVGAVGNISIPGPLLEREQKWEAKWYYESWHTGSQEKK